jgi:hypothetical protein
LLEMLVDAIVQFALLQMMADLIYRRFTRTMTLLFYMILTAATTPSRMNFFTS